MGMFDQIKEAMAMRKESKRIQAEISKISYTHQNGGISITLSGDFTVTAFKVTEEALAEVKAGNTTRFETMTKTVLNAAINRIKQESQQVMQRMMKDGNSPFSK
jgi:DNA-binding protein YbaB